VFPVRYELKFYILRRTDSVFNGLNMTRKTGLLKKFDAVEY
jgi:hypothetical protein